MKLPQWNSRKGLWLCLALPLVGGGLSSLAGGSTDVYETYLQPPLAPPGWLFPVVWTALYLLMGYGLWRILRSDCEQRQSTLRCFGAQLAVNYLWPVLFFRLEWLGASFFAAVLLWALAFWMTSRMIVCDTAAGALQVPYLIWLTFAAYLSFGIWFLNA